MLIEFSVENFLSIKERVTLSMIASDDNSLADNLYEFPNGDRYLKSAVIYGANASGKTNILKAFEFMVNLVLYSHRIQKGDAIAVSPFKLDKSLKKEPSVFEVIFEMDGSLYGYGFSLDHEKVHKEYLYIDSDEDEPTYIFERWNTTGYRFNTDADEQQVLSRRTRENALYLSLATQFNYEKTERIFRWFKNCVKVETDSDIPSWKLQTAKAIRENTHIKELVLDVLSGADFGITDILVSQGEEKLGKQKRAIKRLNDLYSPEKQITKDFRSLGIHSLFGGIQPMSPYLFEPTKPIVSQSENVDFNIHTRHLFIDKKGKKSSVSFRMEEESKGTQKLFLLLGPFLEALQNGHVMILDELDASLHPNLTMELVKLFHDPRRNPKGAQLIFTTHNTNLLDPDLFRRDQIWFTEKQINGGGTKLFSLFDFDDEEKKDIERRYLVGRYGAVPSLREGLYAIPLYPDQTHPDQHLEQTDLTGEKQTNDGDADNEPKSE